MVKQYEMEMMNIENYILLSKSVVPKYDEKKIWKKPSKLKRLLFTFAIK